MGEDYNKLNMGAALLLSSHLLTMITLEAKSSLTHTQNTGVYFSATDMNFILFYLFTNYIPVL